MTTRTSEEIKVALADIHAKKSKAKSKEELMDWEELQLVIEEELQIATEAKKQVTTPMSNPALSSPFVVKSSPVSDPFEDD